MSPFFRPSWHGGEFYVFYLILLRHSCNCIDRVQNVEELHTVNRERNILYTIKIRKTNRTNHFFRENYLPPKHVLEWNVRRGMDVTRKRGRRRKRTLDELRHVEVWKIERGRTRTRCVETRFGKGHEPATKQTAKWMNVPHNLKLKTLNFAHKVCFGIYVSLKSTNRWSL